MKIIFAPLCWTLYVLGQFFLMLMLRYEWEWPYILFKTCIHASFNINKKYNLNIWSK